MSALLLPELARENAAYNRRVTTSVETVARRLETSSRSLTSDAREALRYTLAQAAEARSLWQGTQALFTDGVEGGEARAALRAVLDVFDSWFGLAKSTRELWQS